MNAPAPLLAEFVARYPAQPATAFWRAIEIEKLAGAGIPEGLGLDLGCGDGILTDILFKRIGRIPRLVGIDIDPMETEAARKFDFYERIHTTSAASIPEKDCAFDYVISNSVLEHIPELEPVIAEVGRLLKPGGTFFFTVPSPGFHANLFGAVTPTISRSDYLASLDNRLAHFHYLDENDWRKLCSKYGLELCETEGYLDRTETRRWETLSRFTGGILYSLSGGRRRPIEIQRQLQLRSLQNRTGLPRPIASLFARLISAGVASGGSSDASCLLIIGRKPCAS